VGHVDVATATWANIAANALTLVLVFALTPAGSFSNFRQAFSARSTELARVGFGFHKAVVLFVLSSQADRLVVLSRWSNETLGLYAVALTVAASGLGIVSQTFDVVMLPTIAARTDPDQRRRAFTQALRISMLLLVLTTIAVAIVTPAIVPRLFGPAFKQAVPITLLLLCAYCPLAMRFIIIRGLRGFGESDTATRSEFVTLLVFLLLCWPAGTIGGLAGVAIALLAANLAGLHVAVRFLSKNLGIRLRDWYGLDLGTVQLLTRRSLSDVLRRS
jgi:O-antigen/teichoic acid export membrane protein